MLKNSGSVFLADSDIVGIASIIVNYCVGYESSLAIYREHGVYTADKKSGYTHSATPLRRIVSDINLGLFLTQKGLLDMSDKNIHLIEDNMGEILAHINKVGKVQRYIDGHSQTVRKILEI